LCAQNRVYEPDNCRGNRYRVGSKVEQRVVRNISKAQQNRHFGGTTHIEDDKKVQKHQKLRLAKQ